MSAVQEATFSSLVNVGLEPASLSPIPSKGTSFLAVQNVGFDWTSFPPPTKDALFFGMEAIGFELPPQIDVIKPQLGWGTPVKPRIVRIVTPDAATAITYNYEGDVT